MLEGASIDIQLSFTSLFKVLITVGKDDSDLGVTTCLAGFNVLDNIGLLQECDIGVLW